MTRAILDIHILQNVPPSNINRDDTGTPKTATYGGVRRARVSSQAWKRATRDEFRNLLPESELGTRTKKVAEAVADRIEAADSSLSRGQAVALAAEMMRAATGSKIEVPVRRKKSGAEEEASEESPESSYLMFLGRRQLDRLAELALAGAPDGDVEALKTFLKAKENKTAAQRAVNTRHSVDIALFGRMVADSADLNVDAATQVAHALGTHASDIESDYYTAVDDSNKKEESGAGMIGTIDFNSATLYRYAAVDLSELHHTLGVGLEPSASPSTPAQQAARVFLEGFVTSLPTGKVNTFGHHTLPAAVVVKLRDRRPVSFVGAFEEPVRVGENGGFMAESCDRLAKHVPALEEQYGVAEGDRTWVLRVGEETKKLAALGTEVTLAELLDQVESAVAERLGTGA
ncbi:MULTISPECIES: type I-E CRISPR-associated protein Cas7/Cse4/CasC [unclassified Streptomyces]|uniref:type I-E CRISPR-associated protein Cas7/Cse4/CasC n=1 Tax=unclassified Streptomyces TaxID=2593676 RepID=UPI000CD4A489|nr:MULTISPECIES: type I-E CRISPR-associated protein Cas7/Cse4/CasC [unclassified Streptomyces]